MRIAFVLPGIHGGGPRVIGEYGKGLMESGHDVKILYPMRTGVREILRAWFFRVFHGGRDSMLRGFPGKLVPYHVLSAGLVGKNDILVNVDSGCVLAGAGLPNTCGVKVAHFHGWAASGLPALERQIIKAWQVPAPKIVVASYIKREMQCRGITDPIYVVHNGVNRHAYFPSVPDELRSGVGTVFAGDFTKDPELMLAVFERVSRLRPSAQLTMFGGYPRPGGLPKRTQYVRLPSVSEARDLYSRAAVWFCASRREGFPGVVLEAMACGCAIVSTDCGGTADQIEHGVNGFLTPVHDTERMVSQILKLLDDPGLRQQFVAASQAKLARFTWENAVRNFEAALTAIHSGDGTTEIPGALAGRCG